MSRRKIESRARVQRMMEKKRQGVQFTRLLEDALAELPKSGRNDRAAALKVVRRMRGAR